MQSFVEGLLRLLGVEPWVERRRATRRVRADRRRAREDQAAEQERRQGERRRDERRGRGWLRFWNPP